jgi:hypothetical protein
MANRQDAEAVLAAWREVERVLDQVEPGSAEAEELQAEALRLRDKYETRSRYALPAASGGAPPPRIGARR